MLQDLPAYVAIISCLTVILTFFLFISAVKSKGITSLIALFWLLLTGILAYRGFFQDTATIPPRLMLAMAPPLIFIILLLVTSKGRLYIDRLDLKNLTLLHIVRIPVEVILYLLASYKFIPELMTFAGRNFDILSGITAPIVYFICFKNGVVKNRRLLLWWNSLCLGLLLNIVINAVLSAPFRFQTFAFDQPNVAILYFPFTWLPCFIVIIVLFSHLAAIQKLLRKS